MIRIIIIAGITMILISIYQEERLKREEKERKKAEVRRRLEEEAKANKAKKGFLTPDRKKKLRVNIIH